MCENLTFLGVCVCLNVCILYVCVRVNAGVCRCANQKRYFQDFFASLGQNYYTHKQKAITALLPTAPPAHHSIHETHTLSDPQPLIIISVRARVCVRACVCMCWPASTGSVWSWTTDTGSTSDVITH